MKCLLINEGNGIRFGVNSKHYLLNSSRNFLCPQERYVSSRPQTRKSSWIIRYYKNCWFWACEKHQWRNSLHWLCFNEMVSSSWDYLVCRTIRFCHWYFCYRMHFRWTDHENAFVSRRKWIWLTVKNFTNYGNPFEIKQFWFPSTFGEIKLQTSKISEKTFENNHEMFWFECNRFTWKDA